MSTAARVIVIGAGLSGLTTASLLKNALGAESSVTVLEATPSPGGILSAVALDGMSLDPATDAIATSPDQLACMLRPHGIELAIVRPQGLPQLLEVSGDQIQLGATIEPSVDVVGIEGGMWQLPTALASRVTVHSGVRATRINHAGSGWLISTADGSELSCDAVVAAIPPGALAELLKPGPAEPTPTRFEPRLSVLLVYDRADVPVPRGTGFLRPAALAERMPATGCTWIDVKWPASVTRPDRAVARVVFDASQQGVDDTELRAHAHQLISQLWDVQSPPVAAHVSRWSEGLPSKRTPSDPATPRLSEPGLALVGSARGCTGLGACLGDAERAANQLLIDLGQREPSATPERSAYGGEYA